MSSFFFFSDFTFYKEALCFIIFIFSLCSNTLNLEGIFEYIRQNMLILKFHPAVKRLHVFFSFFHPGMKFHACLFERVLKSELLSRDETCLGTKSNQKQNLFTRFCRDKISSRDELIPVKITGMKFRPGM